MSDSENELGIFQEPSDYYEPEKPYTYQEYELRDGTKINLRLVGHNPLWGHHLWNGARILATYLQDNMTERVQDRTVLELGAGAGLPSMICALRGARHVVVTDYPDHELVDNLEFNAKALPEHSRNKVITRGYRWGDDVSALTTHLPSKIDRFDLLILADLLFNHSCHESLLQSIVMTLSYSASARALVFFTPYRPWLLEKDLAFFDLARADGRFEVEEVGTWQMDKVMFEEDRGDEGLRKTVYGFSIRWTKPALGQGVE